MTGEAPGPGASVAVLTTSGCPHCKRAKDALRAQGVGFEEVDLSTSLELLREVKALTGQGTVPQVRCLSGCGRVQACTRLHWVISRRTAPIAPCSSLAQIFIAGEFIGGVSDLLKIIDDGDLDARLTTRQGQSALPFHIAEAVKRSQEGQVRSLSCLVGVQGVQAFAICTYNALQSHRA